MVSKVKELAIFLCICFAVYTGCSITNVQMEETDTVKFVAAGDTLIHGAIYL